MTISSTQTRISYNGNGVTTIFSFPYYFLSDSDLVVVKRTTSTGAETTLVLTTDYTVTGAGVAAGGSVTCTVAPALGTTLTIIRRPVETQDLDLVENDPLPAEELEKRLDKLTMIAQDLQAQINRCVRLSNAISTVSNGVLPNLLPAGYLLKVNDSGNGFDVIDPTTL